MEEITKGLADNGTDEQSSGEYNVNILIQYDTII